MLTSIHISDTWAAAAAAIFGGLLLTGGCSVLADLDDYQRKLGEGGATTSVGGNGGAGGSGGQPGGSGGDGGSGGVGGLGPITGYDVRPSLVQVRNACMLVDDEQGATLFDVDQGEAASPLAPAVPGDFLFEFYGQAVQQVWAGSNGYIAFGTSAPQAEAFGATSLDGDDVPKNAVLPFWDDLRTNTSGVCYAVSEVSPYRILWITWDRACFADDDSCLTMANSALTFSVGLEETTQTIYVGYLQMDGGTMLANRAKGETATIGVRRDASPGCVASECNELGLCTDGSPCNYTQVSSQTAHDPLPTLELRPHRMTGTGS